MKKIIIWGVVIMTVTILFIVINISINDGAGEYLNNIIEGPSEGIVTQGAVVSYTLDIYNKENIDNIEANVINSIGTDVADVYISKKMDGYIFSIDTSTLNAGIYTIKCIVKIDNEVKTYISDKFEVIIKDI